MEREGWDRVADFPRGSYRVYFHQPKAHWWKGPGAAAPQGFWESACGLTAQREYLAAMRDDAPEEEKCRRCVGKLAKGDGAHDE